MYSQNNKLIFNLLEFICLVLITTGFICAQIATEKEAQDGIPKWLILGSDRDLKRLYNEKEHVALVCVYETELSPINSLRCRIIHKCTVTKVYKGDINIGSKIRIAHETDIVPRGDSERNDYINNLHDDTKGDLVIAFMNERNNTYQTESIYLPKYSKEMSAFLMDLSNNVVR